MGGLWKKEPKIGVSREERPGGMKVQIPRQEVCDERGRRIAIASEQKGKYWTKERKSEEKKDTPGTYAHLDVSCS